jgi:vacuolar-type H+-ATPase subunit F/Vma7
MSRIAVLGESPTVDLFGPAGAVVVTAEGAEQVRAGWQRLPDDVDVVLLTAAAAGHLDPVGLRRAEHPRRLVVVMP